MPTQLIPPGPGVPPSVTPVLQSHDAAIQGLQNPAEPSAVLSVTTAKLPSLSTYRSHIVIVSDVPCLAFSDGVHWRKADGTVII